MSPKVEIFSQGEELVTGQITDTNATWLSEKLIQMGFTVTRHTTVGDKLEDLVGLLREIAERADCCICTGGLGPTVDDLTAEAVAKAFAKPLEFDPVAYQKMAEYFSQRGRPMPESNRNQAMLPKDSIRLDNEWGTAPGFALKFGHCQFAFVPGVPSEMKQMFRQKITPLVLTPFKTQPWKLMTIKTIGMGESDIQVCLDTLIFPEAVQLGFRAGSGEVQTKLLFPPDFPEIEMNNFTHAVAKQMGDPVFAIDRQDKQKRDIATVLGEILHKQQRSLSIMGTISQGLMAAKCIEIDSLSESWFANSVEQICTKFNIEAQDDLLATASEVAEAYRAECGTDYSLVQLCDREAVDSADQKQSVQLYNALATPTKTITQFNRVSGTIKRKQNQAALLGLDFLRRYLQNYIKGS